MQVFGDGLDCCVYQMKVSMIFSVSWALILLGFARPDSWNTTPSGVYLQ